MFSVFRRLGSERTRCLGSGKVVPGYLSYFSAGDRKGYGGVALFTRNKPQAVRLGLGIEGFDDEGRAIVADYGGFLLFNVYFPNGEASSQRLQYKLEFYDRFLGLVDGLKAKSKRIV